MIDNSTQISDFPLHIPNNINICLKLLTDAINKSILAFTPRHQIIVKSQPRFNLEYKIA